MMKKKGVELAFNTIVVAALALLVLLVLIFIFTGGFGNLWNSIFGISVKVTGKGDCLLLTPDTVIDPDGDHYKNGNEYTYTVEYKEDGKKVELDCLCDGHPIDSERHVDDGNDQKKKYC